MTSCDILRETYPTSRSLPFPYPTGPYPQQAALMDALLQGIPPRPTQEKGKPGLQPYSESAKNMPMLTKTRILALESPTGTGKSLSLACAGLAWLEYEEGQYYSNETAAGNVEDGKFPNSAAPTIPPPSKTQVVESRSSATNVLEGTQTSITITGIDWLDSWQPQEDPRVREEQLAKKREQDRHQDLVEALEDLRIQLYPNPTKAYSNDSRKKNSNQRRRERRENMLRMALTKSKTEEQKRARERNRKRKLNAAAARTPLLSYEYNENHDLGDEHQKPKLSNLTPGTAQWLLPPPSQRGICNGSQQQTARAPQIVYAARTHSQLSQFVSEIRKTKWGKSLRVVALGSRAQGLCGAFTNSKSALGRNSFGCSATFEARLRESCLELRKKGTLRGCSYYSSHESVATLALHSMAEASDLEDLVALGKGTKTCAYYAARMAVPHAQLVVLPYASLCSSASRKSLGLELHPNTLVLIDEAHNLPDTIANLSSTTLALKVAQGARHQLTNYIQKYIDRLSSHHLRLLGDLKRLICGLVASMTNEQSKSQHRITEQLQHQRGRQQRHLLSSSQFLVSQKLEAINLFPVLRYMKESKLSQTLTGFMKKRGEGSSSSTGYSSDLNSEDASGIPSYISPMSVVEAFLEKLTYASDNDGQVVVDLGDKFRDSRGSQTISSLESNNEAHLRFCVLNPAVNSRDDLWTAPRAVALVGGTLQPLDVMMRELVPGVVAEHASRAQSAWSHANKAINDSQIGDRTMPFEYRRKPNSQCDASVTSMATTRMQKANDQTKIYRSDNFWAFTCGHVVDPSQVLLQHLTKVRDLTIDVRHKIRSNPFMTKAIGTALVKLCKSIKHGMVVFIPSYKYEAILVDAWKRQANTNEISIWDELQQATMVVREPKEASQVEETLTLYSKAASNSPKGALLLSVVGGKLSEGINFADNLCRCVVVVGLPFADRSDPMMQEKLKLVATGGGTINGTISSKASNEYYRSLCMRAVNQSVGRAIRHAKDWATIILMDARYPLDEAIAMGLPPWLNESTPSWRKSSGELDDVICRTENFFRSQNSEVKN